MESIPRDQGGNHHIGADPCSITMWFVNPILTDNVNLSLDLSPVPTFFIY